MAPRKRISIITPCYNEEVNVRDCSETIQGIFADQLPQYDYEHIFCDNASSDRTVAILRELAAANPRVRVILNARNFGASNSMFNGILSSCGDAVVPMLAADLQDPPELIPTFVKLWEEGHEVVYGIRQEREENVLMAWVRRRYYRVVSRFADIHIPPDVGEFQLVDRCVIQALRGFEDHYPYVRGMILSCGFRQVGVPYTWRARAKGFSKTNLYRNIDLALNGLISFSKVPMRLCMVAGFALAACCVLYALFGLVASIIYYRELAPPGIPTLIVGLFFLAGVQLFFLGVLSEYVLAIHFQVRKRPLVIERGRINFDGPPCPTPSPSKDVG